jgi:hypothetical protein
MLTGQGDVDGLLAQRCLWAERLSLSRFWNINSAEGFRRSACLRPIPSATFRSRRQQTYRNMEILTCQGGCLTLLEDLWLRAVVFPLIWSGLCKYILLLHGFSSLTKARWKQARQRKLGTSYSRSRQWLWHVVFGFYSLCMPSRGWRCPETFLLFFWSFLDPLKANTPSLRNDIVLSGDLY